MAAPEPVYPRIRAIFFDLDGLLLNSEQLYMQCLDTLFRRPNCPRIPPHLLAMLPGDATNITRGSIRQWLDEEILSKPQSPWPDYEAFQLKFQSLCAESRKQTQLLPGAEELLRTLAYRAYLTRGSASFGEGEDAPERPDYMIVSNTASDKFVVKVEPHPVFNECFPASRVLCSDDLRLTGYLKQKKPAPDLYLAALSLLNTERASNPDMPRDRIQPGECLVFEDSIIGVEAARKAGMAVVWVPPPSVLEVFAEWEPKILQGRMALQERMYPWLQEKPEREELSPAERGLAVVLKSLEEVDLTRYGIRIERDT